MVLVTGPTGSGKTTTLYSAINTLNRPDINIMTAEDPVEYNLPGINQVPGQRGDRPHLRRRAARLPAPGPGHHPGRRDPRPRDRADRHPGRPDRPPGAHHAAHQRLPSAVARLLDMGIAPVPGRLLGEPDPGPAAGRAGSARSASEPYEVEEGSLEPYGYRPPGPAASPWPGARGARSAASPA